MRKLSLSIIFLCFVSIQLYACTFIPETFCKSIQIHSENLVVTGEIIGIDSNGMDLEVLEVLRGEESKSVIRIWNGTDFDCNGPFSMSVETIGNLNDTVIISLPVISALENSWDVLGDYRRPNPYSFISELELKNGIVYGLIEGDALAPDENNILEIEYDEFRTSVIDNGDCIGFISSTADLSVFDNVTITNPFVSEVQIRNISPEKVKAVNVYSILGERVLNKAIKAEADLIIDLYNHPLDLYFVEIVLESGYSNSYAIVKY